jgi:hypothetical protein
MTEKNKLQLPSGGWAKFKDASTLRVKDRKKVLKNASKEDEGLMQAISLVDGLIAILVEEWSFEFPIPSIKISVLEDLTMADYDALAEEAGKAQKVLFPQLGKTDASEADEDSPFGKSND